VSDGYQVRVYTLARSGRRRGVDSVVLELTNGTAEGRHLYIVEKEETREGHETGRFFGGRPTTRFGALETDNLDNKTRKPFTHPRGLEVLFHPSIENGADASFLAPYLIDTFGTAALRDRAHNEVPEYADEKPETPAKTLYRERALSRVNGNSHKAKRKGRGGKNTRQTKRRQRKSG
jgi:hypothetical protein